MNKNLRNKRWKNLINETIERVLSEGDEDSFKAKYASIQDWIADLEDAVINGEVASTVKLLNDEIGSSQLGIDFLSSGLTDGDTSDDAINVTPTNIACSALVPTQGQIFFLNSVAYPLTNIGAFLKASQDKTSLLVMSRLSVSDNLVLDGHHRWSGTLAIDPSIKVQVNDFKFEEAAFKGETKGGQKLSVMQMGVGTQMSTGQTIPEAGGKGSNILGANKKTIEDMIWNYCNTPSADEKLRGEKMLSDKWIKEGQDSAETRAAFRDLGYDISDDDWKNAKMLGEESGQKVDCPVRSVVAAQMASNLSTMKPQAKGTPSDRTDMPQLDHDDIGGNSGFEKIKSHADSNEINFDNPSSVFESTTNRWNKLAGLLKD